MRALVVRPGPNFSVEDVATGWEMGLEACGLTVRSFDLSSRLGLFEQGLVAMRKTDDIDPRDVARLACDSLTGALYKFWPDLLVVVSGFFVDPAVMELARIRGTTVVLAFTESPYEDDRQVLLAGAADHVLVNDPTNLDRFRAVNPSTHYMPHGWNPKVHFRREPRAEWRSDFAFVGTGYASRIEFLEAIDWSGLDVTLGGNWQALDVDSPLRRFICHDVEFCLDNDDAADLYSSTRASANIYRREANADDLVDGWAMGPREVELAALGTFFLTEERGENREVLPMLPTFDGPGDLADQLRWWLRHDSARDNAARAAQAAVADRSYPHLAQRLLGIVT